MHDSMPMIPSQPSAVALSGGAIIENPTAAQQLDLLAESIRLAPAPAFFAVWQDGSDSMRLVVDALLQGGLTTPHVIRPDNLPAKLSGLEQPSFPLFADDGVVFLGCLSALHEEECKHFNAARDRLLRLGTKMIFVESIADERKLRLGFPDVLSQVSYDCRLFLRAGEENPFALSDPPSPQVPAKREGSALLSGTVDEVHETDATCWLEIIPGTRVKFAVPLALLRHLNPQPGLEILWLPGKEGEDPTFRRREPKPPDPALVREVQERYQRIRKAVRTWQPHVPENK